MPEPITTTSALTDQPGSGAASRPTVRRTLTQAGYWRRPDQALTPSGSG